MTFLQNQKADLQEMADGIRKDVLKSIRDRKLSTENLAEKLDLLPAGVYNLLDRTHWFILDGKKYISYVVYYSVRVQQEVDFSSK